MRILFLMGVRNATINPTDTHQLSGAEKAIVHIAKHLTRLGHIITICGPVITSLYDDIFYLHYSLVPSRQMVFISDILVIWTSIGLKFYHNFKKHFQTNRIYIDLHTFQTREEMQLIPSETVSVFCKSRFHYEYLYRLDQRHKYNLIPNGIEIEQIDQYLDSSIKRERYRICCASSLDRGIFEMLTQCWPLIREAHPKASFHIYYGRLDYMPNTVFKQQLIEALQQPGIYYHDRVNLAELVSEYQKSRAYLYLTKTDYDECDCLGIREAAYCGCLPVTLERGVFPERPGHLIKYDSQSQQNAAKYIINLLNQEPSDFILDKPELTWSQVATAWNQILSAS